MSDPRGADPVRRAPAVLDIDSDCCPAVGPRAARADELTALAARAGFPVEHLGTGRRSR
ncbi:hypothetical protein ACFWRV_27065 [Streptomyces sp. NPDC058576]|uniref:hypothetical protein n=1 Tax=Streptomyces sp. NPDC058576 TaxID=3346547 RepID=UPI00365C9C16